MKIFPATDIIDGKVVRLVKGDYGKVTEYALTPLQAALSFKEQGADCLHVVDLDGAKSGRAENADIISEIADKTGMFVEVGGGIRTLDRIKRYLDCGVGRVILGTAALKNPPFLKSALDTFGKERIAVGVDACDGKAAVSGWEDVTDTDAFEFCKSLADRGVKYVIYTDISKDGCLDGTNIEVYKRLGAIDGLNVTASGGITYLQEIAELKSMGVYGAILGKALYENRILLADAVKIGGENL